MTTRSVRIPDELDAKLTALAEAEHISVNSAIVRAVNEMVMLRAREIAVAQVTDHVFARHKRLFERLADS